MKKLALPFLVIIYWLVNRDNDNNAACTCPAEDRCVYCQIGEPL